VNTDAGAIVLRTASERGAQPVIESSATCLDDK
jgi:hypothetical protein